MSDSNREEVSYPQNRIEGEPLHYAIDIRGISKRFTRNTAGGYTTLKSWLLTLFTKKQAFSRNITHALSDLTIRIPKGASIGIIGKNGSGKSTLLKLITGIYKPDTGSLSLHGRVSALIELGAGFHPDFTGRENLYLGGIIQGLTRKEIDERFDTIVQFAELSDVIDDPVRTYSSGMFMRLGFSLAVHTDPDVLLIDEVLAVGDAGFVSKCKEKISEMRAGGVTLLLVTHDMSAVERWCDEVLWLNEGVVMERGEPRRVINAYLHHTEEKQEEELRENQKREEEVQQQAEAPQSERWGSREVEITAVRLLDKDGVEHQLFHTDDALTVEIDYRTLQEVEDIAFGIAFHRNDGVMVFGTNTDIDRFKLPKLGKTGTVRCNIERLGFLEGNYLLDAAVHRSDGYAYDYHKSIHTFGVRWPKKQVGIHSPPLHWDVSFGESELSPLEGAQNQ